MSGPRKYEEKYCAFIDILGFRGIVKSLSKDDTTLETLKALLTKIQKPLEIKTRAKSWDTEFSVQSISDALAISTLVSDTGLLQILFAVESLTEELLREGYFIRGALVKGLLYHDEKMVFGDALVKAYELESTVVRFPRVMVTRDVVQDIDRYGAEYGTRKNPYQYRVSQAPDGPHYIHVLRDLLRRMNETYVGNINKRF